MGHWVYRRPLYRQRRRHVPLTRGHGLLVAAFIRRRAVWRRRVYIRRRLAVAGVITRGHGLVFLRPRPSSRALAARRAQRRILVGGVAAPAATAHRVVGLLRRRPPSAKARLRQRKPPVVPTLTPNAPNPTGPVIRFRRAVARMRAAMRARLRWKPRREEIPVAPTVPVFASPKGRIFTPGVERGRIYSPDSRGRVFTPGLRRGRVEGGE